MYRFALRPRWLLSHAFALGLVVLFVFLGFWQLDRHDQKAERNRTVEARREVPAAPVAEVLATAGGDAEDVRYRRATAEGTFLAGDPVLIDNRSHEGLPGAWIVSPLRLDDGSVLAVSRGFQGFESGRIDPPAPPAGEVRVEGTLLPWDGACGVRAADRTGSVGTACLNRDLVEEVVGEPVVPVVLQRVDSVPSDAPDLTAVPPPELDAGPHRSYAVQWFIFATIGVVGYPLILRRVARDRTGGDRDDDGGRPPPLDNETDRGLVSQSRWGRS